MKRRRSPISVVVFQALPIVALPATLVIFTLFPIPSAPLVSLLIACLGSASFFLAYERTHPTPADLMPIVVLATMATVGRILFGPLANIKPVAAITIVGGLSFGPLPGYITGALSMFVSNLFFGQGPWTPWQMFSFGMIGWVSGMLRHARFMKIWPLRYAYAFVSGYLTTMFLDGWVVMSLFGKVTWASVLGIFAAGVSFNLSHGIATAVFLLPIEKPWGRALARIGRKYGSAG